jgi:hypothetical protein
MDYAQTALMAAATSFSTSTVRTEPSVILARADVFLQWLEDNAPDDDDDRVMDLSSTTDKADQDPPNQELHAHHRDEPTYGDDLKVSRRAGFGREL